MSRKTPNFDNHDLKVLTLKECAEIIGISFETLKRMNRRGEGPKTIQLSPRRIGVRIVDLRAWQDARIKQAA
jgi:predicted DNA-binding transcriptional regulator AlpA